jgi:hypothetical protein
VTFVVLIVSIGLAPLLLGPSKVKPFAAWWLYASALSILVFLALWWSDVAFGV